jgi:cytidylate kinase
MSSNYLLKYLDVRFMGELAEPPAEHKGMVITMSRDTGCDGMPILEEVRNNLNANLKGINKKHPWNIVSKEIFEKSARKLNVDVDLFDKLENKKDRSFVEDLLISFSKDNYPSDLKIKRTYKEVIESVAKDGAVFILGRAGVAIVEHNRRNLHIKVTAPFEWRVKKLAKEYGTTEASARKHILDSDEKRDDLKAYYMGRKVHFSDYDVVFNEATLTKKEIALAIQNIVELKQ